MNKSGPRIETCGATDSIFSHELQKEFIFPLFFLSVALYGLVTCSKAVFQFLTIKGKEIAGMSFRNLSKSLKGEEDFSSQTLVKAKNDKFKWVGKTFQKWTLIPLQLGMGD